MVAKVESTWYDLQMARENNPEAVRVIVHTIPEQRESKS